MKRFAQKPKPTIIKKEKWARIEGAWKFTCGGFKHWLTFCVLVRTFICAALLTPVRTVGCKDADLNLFTRCRKPRGQVTNGRSDPVGRHLSM